MDVHKDPKGIAPDKSKTVLLVLDMISDFDFEDGERIARRAAPIAKRIANLKRRARRAGLPVIYVNDCAGRWRSDFPSYVRHCQGVSSRGREIATLLAPQSADYCVLKPKHSGFYQTALDTLLSLIGAEQMILTGVSSHQCVLFTANDAYLRELGLTIPRDCIGAREASATRLALRYFVSVLGADVRPAAKIRFARK
jgi:nicotinamidase-related amidase